MKSDKANNENAGKNRFTPFILAGGQSRRMGTNKSFVKLGEEPLIDRMVARLSGVFGRKPVILTNDADQYSYLGCEMVADTFQNKGPLGGIHAGLVWSPTQYGFFFACDMPFVDLRLIQYMMDRTGNEDILVPCHAAKTEPLHAIYSKNCLPSIESCLRLDRRSILDIFPDVNVAYVLEWEWQRLGLDSLCFMNLNTPGELERAKAMLKTTEN